MCICLCVGPTLGRYHYSIYSITALIVTANYLLSRSLEFVLTLEDLLFVLEPDYLNFITKHPKNSF